MSVQIVQAETLQGRQSITRNPKVVGWNRGYCVILKRSLLERGILERTT